jgi:hypothetical protein
VFLHANQLPTSVQRGSAPLLEPGQRIIFHRQDDPRGPKAFGVILDASPGKVSADEFRAELAALSLGCTLDGVVELAKKHGWVT